MSGRTQPEEPAERYEPDPDEALDLYLDRVEHGEQCGACGSRIGIKRIVALGIPLFECACSATWFDLTETA